MHHLISAVGVLLAVGFMSVSAAMNWRYGHGLGRDPVEQLLYAAIGLMGDVFKAVVPFFIWWSVKARRASVACAAAALWLVCTVYSLGSILGYVQMSRESAAGVLSSKTATFADLRVELSRKQERLQSLGTYDSPAEIEKQLQTLRYDRRWFATNECRDVQTRDVRRFCSQVSVGEAKLARAREAVRLETEIAELQGKLSVLSRAAKIDTSGDPQAAAISRLLRWEVVAAQSALSLLLVALIELGSSVGLFVALNHGAPSGKKRNPEIQVARSVATDPDMSRGGEVGRAASGPGAPGEVERFAEERVMPAVGSSLPVDALFAEYCVWCKREGRSPLERSAFEARFVALADLVGIERVQRGRRAFLKDVVLATDKVAHK